MKSDILKPETQGENVSARWHRLGWEARGSSLGSEIGPWLRWLMVPVASIAASLVTGWSVKAATLYLSIAPQNAHIASSPHPLWHLLVLPAMDSALLGMSFVWAGWLMAPKAKFQTASVLGHLLVGAFFLLTLAVWILEPRAILANVQASVGCLATYTGARLACWWCRSST